MKQIIITFTFLAVVLFTVNLYASAACPDLGDYPTVRDRFGQELTDSDGDKVADRDDNCPCVKNGNCSDLDITTDICEEWVIGFQKDNDKDGIGDDCDHSDTDEIVDSLDNCPTIYNQDQVDRNDDGVGDACTDTDYDGFFDLDDNCWKLYNTDQLDTDEDEIGDACDNCHLVKNPPSCPLIEGCKQQDTDNNGFGDICDGDIDGDGIPDRDDNCPVTPNRGQEDSDSDDYGDVCDNCIYVPNFEQADSDSNGVGDDCEVTADITPVTRRVSGEMKQGSGGCSVADGSGAPLLELLLMVSLSFTPLIISRKRK